MGAERRWPDGVENCAKNCEGDRRGLVGDTDESFTRKPNTRMKEIIGEYVKQQWTGRKQDHAAETGREKFEATNYVLCTLKYEDVIELQDNSECTDAIGNAHVTHYGPHEVYITDAICEYFDVNSLDEITQAAFLSAHQDYMSRPLRPFTVQIVRTSRLLRTVKLNARSASAAKDRALEMAGDLLFDCEKSADYEVENVTPLPFDELSAKSTEQLIAELIAMRAKILMNAAYSSSTFECEIKRLLKDHVPYSSLTREALEDEWITAQAGVQEL